MPGDYRVPAQPGEQIRLRVINTDNGPIEAWSDTPYRLLAIDGTDVNQPGEVVDQSVTLTGGARADLGVTMPADGRPVRVQVSKGTAVILGEGDPRAAAATGSGSGPAERTALRAVGLRPRPAGPLVRLLDREPARDS